MWSLIIKIIIKILINLIKYKVSKTIKSKLKSWQKYSVFHYLLFIELIDAEVTKIKWSWGIVNKDIGQTRSEIVIGNEGLQYVWWLLKNKK